jgi:hypothetical protein
MYHVSAAMVEPHKRDIKVSPPILLCTADTAQLEPIRESYVPSRHQHQHEFLPHATPRYVQNEYLPEVSSYNRPSAPSRRPSEQDVVLPSVERETVDLTSPRRVSHSRPPNIEVLRAPGGYAAIQSPKRKSFPSFVEGRDVHMESDQRPRPLYHEDAMAPRTGVSQSARPIHASSHQHDDARSHVRVQPSREYIDLTSSPRRLPPNQDNGNRMPTYTHAHQGFSGLSYAPAASRPPAVREVGGAYYESHTGGPPRDYVHSGGMHERRAPLIHDYPRIHER